MAWLSIFIGLLRNCPEMALSGLLGCSVLQEHSITPITLSIFYSQKPQTGNMTHHIFLLTSLMLLLLPSTLHACNFTIKEVLNGSDINDIPRNLDEHIRFLYIVNTNISVLNLSVIGGDYPLMCRLRITSSPVITIIIPNPTQNIALTSLQLASGNFPTPPDLGSMLARQLTFLVFKDIGLKVIPENYFENFTSLIRLSLNNNPIFDLNAGNMVGLRNLRSLNLDKTHISPLPPLHLWLPSLRELCAAHLNITVLSTNMLENLPNLKYLDISQNELNTVPDKSHFANLENMTFINLEGNPLHCDCNFCWVKVTSVALGQHNSLFSRRF